MYSSIYEAVIFCIDLKDAEQEKNINLKTLEIILNSFVKDKDLSKSDFVIGTVKYNAEEFKFFKADDDSRYKNIKKSLRHSQL